MAAGGEPTAVQPPLPAQARGSGGLRAALRCAVPGARLARAAAGHRPRISLAPPSR
jgi:hypothetical protein